MCINFNQKKNTSKKIEIIVVEEARLGPMDPEGNHHVRAPHTHAKRPPSTTWIVDEAAAKLADNAAHRAAKTRLIKWKRFTVIQWHTHTQTKITQSKQKSRSRRRRKDLQSYYYHKHSHSYTATKQRKCYSSPFFTLQSHSFPARAALNCRCAAQLSIEMVCQTIQK